MKKLLVNGAAIALFIGVGVGSAAIAKGSESSNDIPVTIPNTGIVNDTFPIPKKPYPWTRSDTAHQRLDTGKLDTGKRMGKNERWEKYHKTKHPKKWNRRKDTMHRRDMHNMDMHKTDTTYRHNR